jgi:hypothetical protein
MSFETIAERRYAMYQAAVAGFGDDDNEFPPEPTEQLPRYCLVERDSHDNKWYDFSDSPERPRAAPLLLRSKLTPSRFQELTSNQSRVSI